MLHASPFSVVAAFAFAIAMASLAGCTSAISVPHELVTARQSYFRAASGPSPAVNAARLAEAKEALDVAERAFQESPESPVTRDLAYIAARDAELVEAETGTMLANLRKLQAQRLLRLQGGHVEATGGQP